jgi:hypothetical protein
MTDSIIYLARDPSIGKGQRMQVKIKARRNTKAPKHMLSTASSDAASMRGRRDVSTVDSFHLRINGGASIQACASFRLESIRTGHGRDAADSRCWFRDFQAKCSCVRIQFSIASCLYELPSRAMKVMAAYALHYFSRTMTHSIMSATNTTSSAHSVLFLVRVSLCNLHFYQGCTQLS